MGCTQTKNQARVRDERRRGVIGRTKGKRPRNLAIRGRFPVGRRGAFPVVGRRAEAEPGSVDRGLRRTRPRSGATVRPPAGSASSRGPSRRPRPAPACRSSAARRSSCISVTWRVTVTGQQIVLRLGNLLADVVRAPCGRTGSSASRRPSPAPILTHGLAHRLADGLADLLDAGLGDHPAGGHRHLLAAGLGCTIRQVVTGTCLCTGLRDHPAGRDRHALDAGLRDHPGDGAGHLLVRRTP